MDILFVTSTLAPYSGAGPVAETCSALAKALRSAGHRVVVVSPLYASVDPSARSLARRLSKLDVRVGNRDIACEIYDGRTTGGVDLVFIGEPELLAPWQPPDASQAPSAEDALRAALLGAAAARLGATSDTHWDVLHANDWTGAMALVYAAQEDALAQAGRVLSVHQADQDARFEPAALEAVGLAETLGAVEGASQAGQLGLLAAGIVCADRVVLPSEILVSDLMADESSYPLRALLAQRRDDTLGILPGVDGATWNPLTDAYLPARFDPVDLKGKASCKASLQRRLDLPVDNAVPVLGVIDALAGPGGRVVVDALPEVLHNEAQVVIAGGGDPALLQALQEMASTYPERLCVLEASEAGVAHQALAAADLLLIPPQPAASTPPASQLYAAELSAMRAHRYGALPIAEHSPGLADVIVDCDAALETGTGFLFARTENDADPTREVLAAVQRGLAGFTQRDAFAQLRRRVLRLDHSWDRTARRYDRVYAAACREREA